MLRMPSASLKRIFKIAWTLFEIILFIHFYPLKKTPGQSQKHLWKKPQWTIVYDIKWIHLVQKIFDFHEWVKKCHLGNFPEFSKIAKMALFYPCMQIKKILDQMYSFDVVNNNPLWVVKLADRMRSMRTTGASKNRDCQYTKWLAFSSWANLKKLKYLRYV